MHDHRAAGDVVLAAAEADAERLHVHAGHAIGVGDDVVHVAAVVRADAGAAVRLLRRD